MRSVIMLFSASVGGPRRLLQDPHRSVTLPVHSMLHAPLFLTLALPANLLQAACV